jgi:hypothetical protein
MEIYDITFESNQVIGSVSETESCYKRFLPKELSQIVALLPGGEQPLTGRHSLNFLNFTGWINLCK